MSDAAMQAINILGELPEFGRQAALSLLRDVHNSRRIQHEIPNGEPIEAPEEAEEINRRPERNNSYDCFGELLEDMVNEPEDSVDAHRLTQRHVQGRAL